MTEPIEPSMIAVQLDADRRREIDAVRVRMDDFLKNQIELKHSMEIVAGKQDQLKERFEIGTARTLRELNEKFDAFRVEWGTKKAEDVQRDREIVIAKEAAQGADDKGQFAIDTANKIVMGFAYTILGTGAVTAVIWAFAKFAQKG